MDAGPVFHEVSMARCQRASLYTTVTGCASLPPWLGMDGRHPSSCQYIRAVADGWVGKSHWMEHNATIMTSFHITQLSGTIYNTSRIHRMCVGRKSRTPSVLRELVPINSNQQFTKLILVATLSCMGNSLLLVFILFYVLSTSKVISIGVLTCGSADSWQLYNPVPLGDQAASTMTWYLTQLHYSDTEPTSHRPILIMLSTHLRNDAYQYLSHWFNSTRVRT